MASKPASYFERMWYREAMGIVMHPGTSKSGKTFPPLKLKESERGEGRQYTHSVDSTQKVSHQQVSLPLVPSSLL